MGKVNEAGEVERLGQRLHPFQIEAQYLIRATSRWQRNRWTAWRLVATFRNRKDRDTAMILMQQDQPEADFRAVNYQPLRYRYPFFTWAILLCVIVAVFYRK